MTQRISDTAGSILPEEKPDHIPMYGEFHPVIHRADGTIEDKGWIRNQLTANGLNRIANRAIMATGTTPFYVLGVGTFTAASSLDSTDFGEIANGRKVGITNPASSGLSAIQSREWIAIVATWAGNADSLTGQLIDSAALLCHASSGQGTVANIVNGMGVTLQASDYLNLTGRIRVGSHNSPHTG
jgi:hypothetical protein